MWKFSIDIVKNIPLQSVLLCVYYKDNTITSFEPVLGRQPWKRCNAPRVGHCEARKQDKSDTCRKAYTPAGTGGAVCAPSAGCAASACGPGTGGVLFFSAVGCSPFFFLLPAWLRAGVSLETPAPQPVTGRFWTPGTQTEARLPLIRPKSAQPARTPQNRGQGATLTGRGGRPPGFSVYQKRAPQTGPAEKGCGFRA